MIHLQALLPSRCYQFRLAAFNSLGSSALSAASPPVHLAASVRASSLTQVKELHGVIVPNSTCVGSTRSARLGSQGQYSRASMVICGVWLFVKVNLAALVYRTSSAHSQESSWKPTSISSQRVNKRRITRIPALNSARITSHRRPPAALLIWSCCGPTKRC